MTQRRNLSGIYIFEKFEDDDKRKPICFEDCREETQNEWLESLNREGLIKTIKSLAQTIKDIGDEFDIMSDIGDEFDIIY